MKALFRELLSMKLESRKQSQNGSLILRIRQGQLSAISTTASP